MFHTWPVKTSSTRGQLEPDVRVREERDQAEHEPRQEAEDGDALEDVDDGDHHPLRPLVVRGDGPVDERERERDDVGDHAAGERERGVEGESRRGEIDLHRLAQGCVPAVGQRHDPADQRAESEQDDGVDPPPVRREAAPRRPGCRGERAGEWEWRPCAPGLGGSLMPGRRLPSRCSRRRDTPPARRDRSRAARRTVPTRRWSRRGPRSAPRGDASPGPLR